MTHDERLEAAMVALAPISFALEAHVIDLGWVPARSGSGLDNDTIGWNLWLPEQVLPPVVIVALNSDTIEVYGDDRQYDFCLADPKCFDKLDARIRKLETRIRGIIRRRTAKLARDQARLGHG